MQDLVRLFDVYLTPLQRETFLSKDEVNTLALAERMNAGHCCL